MKILQIIIGEAGINAELKAFGKVKSNSMILWYWRLSLQTAKAPLKGSRKVGLSTISPVNSLGTLVSYFPFKNHAFFSTRANRDLMP